MAISSPQDMNLPQTRAEGSGRLGNLAAPKLDKGFLNVLNQEIDQQEAAGQAAAKEKADFQLKFNLASFKNRVEREALYPSLAEVSSTKGLNTLDAVPKTRERLARQVDKIAQEFPSEYRPYLQMEADNLRTRFEKTVVPHQYKETNQAVAEEFKAFTAGRVNEAVEVSGDPFELNEKLGELSASIMQQAQISGLSEEQTQMNVREGVSKTLLQSVGFQASMGRSDIAKNTLRNFEDEFSPEDRKKAVDLLNKMDRQMETDAASRLAEKVYNKYPDEVDRATFEIQQMPGVPDAVKRQALAFDNQRRAAVEKAKENNYTKLEAQIWNNVDSGKPWANDLKQLPADRQSKIVEQINANRGKLPTVTNWQDYEEVQRRLLGAASARDLPNDYLSAYRGSISAKDMKPLESLFEKIKEQDSKEVRQGQLGLDGEFVQEMAREMARAAGISSRNAKKMGEINKISLETYLKAMDAGKNMTRKEIRVEMFKLLKDKGYTTEEKNSRWDIFDWFDRDNTTETKFNANLPNELGQEVHSSVYDYYRKKFPKLNETQINGIVRKAAQSGVDVTRPRN